MADLNKVMTDVQIKGNEINKSLHDLLGIYGDLYRESNQLLIQQRIASGGMEGLEVFYRLVQTVRRNRDVVSSLIRGTLSLRPLNEFKFIEEDVPEKPKQKKEKKKASQEPAKQATPEPVMTGEENAK